MRLGVKFANEFYVLRLKLASNGQGLLRFYLQGCSMSYDWMNVKNVFPIFSRALHRISDRSFLDISLLRGIFSTHFKLFLKYLNACENICLSVIAMV